MLKFSYWNIGSAISFFLWPFYPIPGHGLPLRGFASTLIHTTVSKNSLDKWLAYAETSTWQHTTLGRDIYASNGIRTRSVIKQEVTDPRLRRSDRRNQLKSVVDEVNWIWSIRGTVLIREDPISRPACLASK
jgi:hypothetical protein